MMHTNMQIEVHTCTLTYIRHIHADNHIAYIRHIHVDIHDFKVEIFFTLKYFFSVLAGTLNKLFFTWPKHDI
jgi:hypothetical protein